MPKLVRITTVPISLQKLLTGQMKFMRKHGLEVTMMSADGPEIHDLIKDEACPHIVIPLTRKITPFTDIVAILKMVKHFKRLKPDIVHSHTPKAGLVGMIAAWVAKVPIRIHTIAGLPLETTTGPKRKLLLFIEKLTYAFSTEVWPNSESLKKFILDQKLLSPDKVKIIGNGSSNGIETSEFEPSSLDQNKLDEIKKSIKFDKKNTYLLFVGRMVKDKGVEELVMVFSKLKQIHNNLKLVLVGPLEAHLDPISLGILNTIQMDEDIIATGFSNDVKYYMHLADLFIFPSHREGFPNVPMQAGLMECPVVASRITGNIDIIEDGVDGVLFEKSNIDEMETLILDTLENLDTARERASRFKSKIIANYDRKTIHKELLNNYERLLS